jgi:VWFA-related protein
MMAMALFAMPLLPVAAQSAADGQKVPDGYTLKVNSRLIVTDVTVVDDHGNPVHGLPKTSFHLFDNKKPQTIKSFEEHTYEQASEGTAQTKLGPNTFSNRMDELPAVLDVLVIDTTNVEIEEQLYLSFQLMQFVKNLPAGRGVAIYARNGPVSVLLQSFTRDHALLMAAVRKAVPKLPPSGKEYLSDLETLHQLAVYLAQLPGRKNILWFSGGSTSFLQDIATGEQSLPQAAGEVANDPLGGLQSAGVPGSDNSKAVRAVYDELEVGRIAVYPIDIRGLSSSNGSSISAQHMQMDDVAEATGGRAYYNGNGLAQVADKIVSQDASFYTLTYTPTDYQVDGAWHTIRLEVDGRGRQLGYRRGYYADGTDALSSSTESVRSGSATKATLPGTDDALPNERSRQIVFDAHIDLEKREAGNQKLAKGTTAYSIHYSVPADALTQVTVNGQQRVVLGLVAIAFNDDGVPTAREAQRMTLAVNAEKLKLTPQAPVSVEQNINLGKGTTNLYLAVWDMRSGRLGTLQVRLDLPKPK